MVWARGDEAGGGVWLVQALSLGFRVLGAGKDVSLIHWGATASESR